MRRSRAIVIKLHIIFPRKHQLNRALYLISHLHRFCTVIGTQPSTKTSAKRHQVDENIFRCKSEKLGSHRSGFAGVLKSAPQSKFTSRKISNTVQGFHGGMCHKGDLITCRNPLSIWLGHVFYGRTPLVVNHIRRLLQASGLFSKITGAAFFVGSGGIGPLHLQAFLSAQGSPACVSNNGNPASSFQLIAHLFHLKQLNNSINSSNGLFIPGSYFSSHNRTTNNNGIEHIRNPIVEPIF